MVCGGAALTEWRAGLTEGDEARFANQQHVRVMAIDHAQGKAKLADFETGEPIKKRRHLFTLTPWTPS